MIVIENEKQFEEIMAEKGDIIIDFYADWCPPCRQLMPVIESVSMEERFSHIKFLKVNVTSFDSLSRKYEITSIPTLIFISKNEEQPNKSHSGFIEKEALISLVEEFFL